MGYKIKEKRKEKNMTQEELAARAELTKGFISQVERDITSLSISTLVDVLECLGTNLKDFFSDYEDDNDTDDKVLDHISGIDFLLVLMCDCDFDTDKRAPYDDHRRKSHNDVDPERIHKRLQFSYDFRKIVVESCCK